MGAQRRSAAEVNFARLARRMEEMVRDREVSGWRFGRYLQALRGRLGELKRLEGALRPDAGRLKYYEERVAMLQSVLAAEQKASVQEKAELLAAVPAPSAAAAAASATNVVSADAVVAAVSGVVDGGDEATARDVVFSREVLTLSKAHLQAQTRRELLSFSRHDDHDADNNDKSSGARRRRRRRSQSPTTTTTTSENPAAASASTAEKQAALQDSVTENMLQLARSLKQSAQMSGDTVRSDLAKIRQLSDLSDANFGRLKTESGRLDQQLSRQCSWLLWLMVALVAVTFVGMVLFMRLFSKKIRPAAA